MYFIFRQMTFLRQNLAENRKQLLATQIESLVKNVIKNKKEGIVGCYREENDIDKLVYHLYGLTYDEVLIIDPTPPFTQEEYEQDNL